MQKICCKKAVSFDTAFLCIVLIKSNFSTKPKALTQSTGQRMSLAIGV